MAIVGILGQTGVAIQAKTGTGSRTAAGDFSVTGIGFQPDMVVIIGSYFGIYVGIKSNAVGDIDAIATNLSCYNSDAGTRRLNVTVLGTDGFTANLNSWGAGTLSYTWYAYKFS